MIIKKNVPKKEVLPQDKTQEEKPLESVEIQEKSSDEIDLFNLDNIDFKQRQERRTGDRRRGFRRLDDRNLISRAREEAAAIREAAAKEGYQNGLSAAKADIADVKEALTTFMNAKQVVFDEISPHILEISLDIAKKIIKKEVSEDPEVLKSNVQEILKNYSKGEGSINIKVNPSQVDLLRQEIPSVLNTIGSDANVKVVADEEVMEGGCIVTTQNGVIDATIETQLSIISEALKEV
jgi:flagellar assembly protein FliH